MAIAVKKFTISRKTWHRGGSIKNEDTFPYLLNEHGKQCCIGFYAEACSIPRDQLLNMGELSMLPNEYHNQVDKEFFIFNDDGIVRGISDLHDELVHVNDSPINGYTFLMEPDSEDDNNYHDLVIKTERQREEIIIKRFASIGIKVTIVD